MLSVTSYYMLSISPLSPSLLYTPPSVSPRLAAPVPVPKISRDACNPAICHLWGLTDIFKSEIDRITGIDDIYPLSKRAPRTQGLPRSVICGIVDVRVLHTGFVKR